MQHIIHTKRAFSLVELSIVLVILGLLTGGILTGQNLIRAAELRTITTQFTGYQTAINTFQDRYLEAPGDMRNATKFWGRLNTNADFVTNSSAAVATPGVCDGDGNGEINNPSGSGESAEQFMFWRHLALAGMVEAEYTGISASGAGANSQGYGSTAGENVPASKISNGNWDTNYREDAGAASDFQFNVNYGNHLILTEHRAQVASNVVSRALLTPEEAWNVDTKIDDGRPAYGQVIGLHWNNLCTQPNSGTASKDNLDASYRLSDSSPQCLLYFRNVF
jgi:prepilin-type N-terminal cleavage/methylation domain-containing protein